MSIGSKYHAIRIHINLLLSEIIHPKSCIIKWYHLLFALSLIFISKNKHHAQYLPRRQTEERGLLGHGEPNPFPTPSVADEKCYALIRKLGPGISTVIYHHLAGNAAFYLSVYFFERHFAFVCINPLPPEFCFPTIYEIGKDRIIPSHRRSGWKKFLRWYLLNL